MTGPQSSASRCSGFHGRLGSNDEALFRFGVQSTSRNTRSSAPSFEGGRSTPTLRADAGTGKAVPGTFVVSARYVPFGPLAARTTSVPLLGVVDRDDDVDVGEAVRAAVDSN